jgi:hypothetical protein
LAEPNLIASNGKEASFLAGGEYPYPIATPSGSGTSFSIMFKEYGVRLNFTPTVLGGDMVHIKVRPEVSALDFANSVTLEGFRIPALTTRRTETEVELHDGQTFAIAGLMNNTLTTQLSKIPGIGDIPILGLLFQSKAHQKNQTELVVMITPQIIKRGQPGVSEGLPSLIEPYLGPPNKSLPNPDAYVGSPRYPVTSKGRAEAPVANQPPAASGAPPAAVPAAALPSRPVTDQPQQPVVPPMPATEQGQPQPQPAAAAADQQPAPADAAPANVSQPLTKEQLKSLERAREEERKAAARQKAADEKAAEQQRKAEAAAEKQRLEQEKRDAEARKTAERAEEKRRAEEERKAEEMKKQGAKLDLERQEREAELARKNAEEASRQAEEEEQRRKPLTDAELRLKQAQEAYQAEVARTTMAKGGSK